MGIGISRVGDTATGICYAHKNPISVTGIVTSGASSVTCEGKAVARIGDQVTFSCGHIGVISTCSSSSKVEGLGIARVGDSVTGSMIATLVSGSGNIKTA